MNYILRIFCFLHCSSVSYGQNPVNKMYQGEKDGDHSDNYINGNVRCTYTIKNGNLEGIEQATQKNIAGEIIKYIERNVV